MIVFYFLCSLEKLLKTLKIGALACWIESRVSIPDEVHKVHKFTEIAGVASAGVKERSA